MEKVIKNGCVAVLYSPGFGAGWYSWNKDHEACLFDPEIVALVESKPARKRIFNPKDFERYRIAEKIAALAESKWAIDGNSFYTGGADDLCIEWVPQGRLFKIREYDGSETVEIMEASNGWIAA
jgi:hypothetical protein